MQVSSDMSIFFLQAEDGIRDLVRSRGLGDVYKRQLYAFVESKHKAVLVDIAEKKVLDNDIKERMTKAIDAFKKTFVPGGKPKAAVEEEELSLIHI